MWSLLRKLGSPFQGHPHWLKLPGVEVSTGSLGQGLSIAVGMALAGKLDGQESQDLLHHGRRRTAGRPGLGSRHGGRAPPARQPDRHRRLQPPADRWPGRGRDECRAAGRKVPQLRLGSDAHRRPRHAAGGRRARRSQERRCGKPVVHSGRHRQGQRRQLHGKHCGMARQVAQPAKNW